LWNLEFFRATGFVSGVRCRALRDAVRGLYYKPCAKSLKQAGWSQQNRFFGGFP
jgi:hypothetical protein